MTAILAAGLLLLAAGAARAADIPLAQGETAIPPGETRAFEFGTVPQQETTVLLEVSARLDAASASGSMYFVKLVLNGREVKAARSRTAIRLTNKPLVSPVSPNLPAPWFGSGGWRVPYAPDFAVLQRSSFYQGDPYTLVLDVTDLTNPAAENRLEVTNTISASIRRAPGVRGTLVLEKLVVCIRPVQSPMMAGAAEAAPVINTGQPGAGPASYKGEVLPGGGIALTVGGRRWELSSAFSYPNAGLNRLVPAEKPDPSGQKEWRVVTRPPQPPRTRGGQQVAESPPDLGGPSRAPLAAPPGSVGLGGASRAPLAAPPGSGGLGGPSGTTAWEVTASGPDYHLRRVVRFTPRKVEVADTLTNRHGDAPLGLLARHEVSLAGLQSPPVRLAGNPDPAVEEYYSPPNPSVHVAAEGHSLGLICEDDVFRNQARLFCTGDPPAAGIRTEMLRLAPGESYTLRWSIYPVASRDYYDFINLVRQEWGANFTVAGAWTFFSPDTILKTPVEDLRAQFQRLGIRCAVYCGGWVDPQKDRKRIGFGTGVLDDYWADFRGRLRAAAARLREASPGVKVLVYYDTQRDTSEGGHERFRDSWLTNVNGNQQSTEWNGQYSLTWSAFATLENSFGRAMLAAAGRYLDEMGIDGLYWDEMENVAYGMPLLTYSRGDGHTCLMDPKSYAIQREVGLTTLLGEGHRLDVIERVRRRGGFLMGNGQAHTRALLATGVQRMVEIQHNDHWCFEGDLGTPLGYASARTDFGNVTRALRMARLLVGTRYDYAHEISRYLFPFTPIELHHGYLLGKERIVTLHPGRYGWPSERCLVQVHHFDREGKRTGTDYPTTVAREARTTVRPGEEEVVVLERLPVTLDPLGGTAEVSGVRYSSEGLELRVTSAKGATLRVDGGRMVAVPAGREVGVRLAPAR